MALAQGAELGNQKLSLAGSGYVLLREAPTARGRLALEFNGRPEDKERLQKAEAGEVAG